MKPRVPLKPPKMVEVSTDVDRVVDLDTTIETAAIPEGDPTATTDITGATDVHDLAGRGSSTILTHRAPLGDETELTDAGELPADDDFPGDEPTRDDVLEDDEPS